MVMLMPLIEPHDGQPVKRTLRLRWTRQTCFAFPFAPLRWMNYLPPMQTIFRLNTDELDEQFLASVRATFPHKEIKIAVAEVDETAHLRRSEANRERLLRALADVEAGRNLVTVPASQLE